MSYSVDNAADKVYLQRLFTNNMVRQCVTKLRTQTPLYKIKKVNKLF